ACRPFGKCSVSVRPFGEIAKWVRGGRNLFTRPDQAARSPLLLADLPDTALSGGFRGAIATTVNKPDNDDPSIVEPIELAVEPGLHLDGRPRPTSLGRWTSPTSRSSAGAGSTCPPCLTISRATFWPGSYARPWRLPMYRIRCRRRCRRQVWTRSRSCIGRGY